MWLKNAYVVSAKNLKGKSDNLHFTDDSYKILGKRYAKQWMRSIGMTINELPDTVVEVSKTVCDKYKFNDKTYTKSQQLKKTDVLVNDQNKITLINLTVNKSAKTKLDPVTVEGAYTWPVDGKTYTESQTLTFKGKTVNGCDSIVTCVLTVSGATAIDDVPANEKITLYPNPAIDVLNISVPSCAAGSGKIVIYTAAGIEVFSSNFISELETIDVATWNNDIYIVQITDADGNLWTGKFVKFD
ncbi:MAG: T9SS type A sorting domain-containing protein [Salinivirgaceae bacterium]|nr:T9SS type A sorting domain-containing protein [Salinivirgaceae bacterium]